MITEYTIGKIVTAAMTSSAGAEKPQPIRASRFLLISGRGTGGTKVLTCPAAHCPDAPEMADMGNSSRRGAGISRSVLPADRAGRAPGPGSDSRPGPGSVGG